MPTAQERSYFSHAPTTDGIGERDQQEQKLKHRVSRFDSIEDKSVVVNHHHSSSSSSATATEEAPFLQQDQQKKRRSVFHPLTSAFQSEHLKLFIREVKEKQVSSGRESKAFWPSTLAEHLSIEHTARAISEV